MATHDYVIDNQTPANLRADLNNALQAIVTQNSGSSAPTTTFGNMLWYDTANNQIKKRNEADSAWIALGTIDETTGKFTPNAAITTSEIAAATLVTSTDTIASNNNNTTIPTSAAVKAYADGAATTAAVLSATAGASIGAVGTYIWAGQNAQTTYNAGQTYAGSSLVAAGFMSASGYSDNTAADILGGYTLSGTWRAMGEANSSATRAPTTLFLRVA